MEQLEIIMNNITKRLWITIANEIKKNNLGREVEYLYERFLGALVRAKEIPVCEDITNATLYFGIII